MSDALRRAARGAGLLMALLFAAAAAVQYNDPDPWRWIALYTAAALVSLLASFGRASWIPPACVAVVSAVWAARLLLEALPTLRLDELWSGHPSGEQARELFGLALVTVWTAWLALRARRARLAG